MVRELHGFRVFVRRGLRAFASNVAYCARYPSVSSISSDIAAAAFEGSRGTLRLEQFILRTSVLCLRAVHGKNYMTCMLFTMQYAELPCVACVSRGRAYTVILDANALCVSNVLYMLRTFE